MQNHVGLFLSMTKILFGELNPFYLFDSFYKDVIGLCSVTLHTLEKKRVIFTSLTPNQVYLLLFNRRSNYFFVIFTGKSQC